MFQLEDEPLPGSAIMQRHLGFLRAMAKRSIIVASSMCSTSCEAVSRLMAPTGDWRPTRRWKIQRPIGTLIVRQRK